MLLRISIYLYLAIFFSFFFLTKYRLLLLPIVADSFKMSRDFFSHFFFSATVSECSPRQTIVLHHPKLTPHTPPHSIHTTHHDPLLRNWRHSSHARKNLISLWWIKTRFAQRKRHCLFNLRWNKDGRRIQTKVNRLGREEGGKGTRGGGYQGSLKFFHAGSHIEMEVCTKNKVSIPPLE